MKHILAILALAAAFVPQPASAQVNTDGLMEFTQQRIAKPGTAPAMKPIPLPPVAFDREYKGKLTVVKENDYVLVRYICRENPQAIACSYRVHNSINGNQISCLVILGPVAHNDERALRHEIGHCNGWSNAHERARHDD
jgi:hypothetical protein